MTVEQIEAAGYTVGEAYVGEDGVTVWSIAGHGVQVLVRDDELAELELPDEAARAAAAAELEQREAEQQARADNADVLRARLEQLLVELTTATDAITAGTLFAALSNAERAYLRRVGRASMALIRLQLALLDEVDPA